MGLISFPSLVEVKPKCKHTDFIRKILEIAHRIERSIKPPSLGKEEKPGKSNLTIEFPISCGVISLMQLDYSEPQTQSNYFQALNSPKRINFDCGTQKSLLSDETFTIGGGGGRR